MTVIVIVIIIIILYCYYYIGGYIRGNQGIAWGIIGWGALMMLCVRGCVVIAGVELLVFDLCCKFNKMTFLSQNVLPDILLEGSMS